MMIISRWRSHCSDICSLEAIGVVVLDVKI